MTAAPLVGILALQGGVAEHVAAIGKVGGTAVLVRRAQQFAGLDALVLPGGESSTMDRLLRTFKMTDPLVDAIRSGIPVLGTCAGLVLLASSIEDPAPGQHSLGILDITVRRNAFGAQIASEATAVDIVGAGFVHAAFIRAPIVTKVGADIEVIGRHRGAVVAVRSGAVTGISFHPELTGDVTMHRDLLVGLIAAA